MKRLKYILSLLLFACWLPAMAQSDIEITDSTSTEWGDNIGGEFFPNLPTDPVTSITLSQASIALEGGERIRLTALTNSTAANKLITWSVADSKIAMVSNTGTVTGLKKGTTTVTATSVSNPEVYATCQVTVTSDYVDPSSGWILPWGKDEAWTMKYKYFEQANYAEPANDAFGRSWKELNYNDASWETLTGPMGSEGIWYAPYNYVWRGEYNCFCLRRTFDLPVVGIGVYSFKMQHDDDIKVFLNGKLVVDEPDWTDERISTYEIPNDAFVAGENLLAIYIQQNWGGAYLDYGLYYESIPMCDVVVSASEGGTVTGAGTYEPGSKVTLTAIPEDGFRFVKWSDGTTDNPYTFTATENKSLTATFESIPYYNIIYMVDGVEYKRVSVMSGSKITAETEPVKEGHSFTGWSGLPEIMPEQDVIVTGRFVANSYEITYMLNEEVFKTAYIMYGTTITPPEVPAKEGHTFNGWTGLPATMPANDVTVTGSYTVNTYKVTYMLDGEVLKTEQVVYGATIPIPEVPAKEGYNFSGWGEIPTTMPAQDLTFTGSYTINKDLKYSLIYMVDGVEYKRVTLSFMDRITLEAAPTKEGHTFSGWSEVPETMPLHDVTVTGSFTVNKYLLTYTVDGEVYHTDSIAYGTVLTAIEAPVKEGHTFSGWNGLPETMPAKDVTVTGSFVTNGYTLTYVVDGETYRTLTVEYGATITAEAEPTKEGHTFSGWSAIPETMPAENVTVTGSFTVNKYLLTYTVDGEVYHTDSIAYGTALTAIDAPVEEGRTFSGWSGLPETMPAKDVTVTGSFVTNGYTLTYVVDGEEYKKLEVEYGATITAEAEPMKEGHTFSGWSKMPETMPAENVTVTGSFTVNKYLVTFKIGDEVVAADSLDYGTAIVAPEAPEKEGYTFDGWGEVAETVPANDVTYEGTYTVNIYKVYYYVGDELVHTAEVAYGEAIPEYVYEPTEEGYTFLGWVGETYETMPAHDVTYTANIDDGIAHSTLNPQRTIVYDLTGRKVTDTENLKGGVYIVNGRKVVLR